MNLRKACLQSFSTFHTTAKITQISRPQTPWGLAQGTYPPHLLSPLSARQNAGHHLHVPQLSQLFVLSYPNFCLCAFFSNPCFFTSEKFVFSCSFCHSLISSCLLQTEPQLWVRVKIVSYDKPRKVKS